MRKLKGRIRAKFHRRASTDSDVTRGESGPQSSPEMSPRSSPQMPRSLFGRASYASSLDSAARRHHGTPEPQPQDGGTPATNLDNVDTSISAKLPSTQPTITSSVSTPAENIPPKKGGGQSSGQTGNKESVKPVPVAKGGAEELDTPQSGHGTNMPVTPTESQRPREAERRQSLLPTQQTTLIKTLLDTGKVANAESGKAELNNGGGPESTISGSMLTRKIWVKRPNSSATLVTINEDDLVDDVREMILRKYANSLGRNFDAPDVTLKICSREHARDHTRDHTREHNREHRHERVLGPEEPISRTIDLNFPGGQTVHEALIIDVPVRRTPRQSPRATLYYHDELRPSESGTDYFPPMPVTLVPSPHHQNGVSVPTSNSSSIPHSMSVLGTGHIPNLPSPGRKYVARPRVPRGTSTSPPINNGQQTPGSTVTNGRTASPHGARSRAHPVPAEHAKTPPAPHPPTPPAADTTMPDVVSPPPRDSSPLPTSRPKKPKRLTRNLSPQTGGMLNGANVPPINVLIVEDNIINLKLLEAFMKRLKVRWQTAMDGKEAMVKWRQGGFHLVLMDIQLPVMNGLEATREIRRLERLNGIGVFPTTPSTAPEKSEEPKGDDNLPNRALFKTPVIIVALTASSLQSDRHEALASGCNDFLTKPVNFVWLERKVMEWGCMQALIDFDGWRKWKDYSTQEDQESHKAHPPAAKKNGNGSKGKGKKSRMSVIGREGIAASATIREESEDGNEGKKFT